MAIWFKQALSLADFEGLGAGTMGEHIGIRFSEVGDDFLKATMPVDHRTIQPYGLLHGGASVALAETLGSVGAAMVIDPEKFICVGQEINANHLRGVKQGLVTGITRPVHIGNNSHVWEIRIYDEQERLVCISRLTVAILQRRS
ncbi:MAG: hotdog fold thioesterase [Chitinophagaceae bacterium]|nr:hotdog fold thioesterase [Chitinophagaceae bacterium]